MKNNVLQIVEWQRFDIDDIQKICGNENNARNNANRAKRIFEELSEFAKQKDSDKFIRFYGKNTLQAKNFVGLIQTKSGFCIEILPKILNKDKLVADSHTQENMEHSNQKCKKIKKPQIPFNKIYGFLQDLQIATNTHYQSQNPSKINRESNLSNNELCESCKAKQVLLNCLATFKNSPFKPSNLANLYMLDMPLLEIFALMFLNELENLVQKGLKSSYLNTEQNRKFLKGKLLLSQNIKQNFIHKEHFFTSSDEFSTDIAPNRLIKSTILLLCNQHFSAKTSLKLNQMRFIFEDIKESKNFTKDFSKCLANRNFSTYKNLLAWCEVFLQHKSFSTYSGSKNAFALLFDMNKLFESFVAHQLKKMSSKELEICTQSMDKHLIKEKENEKDLFALKPDIVIKDKNGILIIDTKWKISDSSNDERKFGVLQSDLYQMWAYASKYALELQGRETSSKNNSKNASNFTPKRVKVYLIYPQCEATDSIKEKWQKRKWHFKASKIYSHFADIQILLEQNIQNLNSKNTHSEELITLELKFFPLL